MMLFEREGANVTVEFTSHALIGRGDQKIPNPIDLITYFSVIVGEVDMRRHVTFHPCI